MLDVVGIYCIENTVYNKKYIGQSIHVHKRWKEHKNALNRKAHENDYLQKSWDKYNAHSFAFYVLEECDEADLDDRESYYIQYFNTFNVLNNSLVIMISYVIIFISKILFFF